MKKIKFLFSAALLSLVALSSCNYTELDPTDMVGPDKAFSNLENVHKAVIGIYGKTSLKSKLQVAEYIADDCKQGGDSGGSGTGLTNWVYVSTSGEVGDLWNHYYGIINQANRVLYYAPGVPVSSEEEQLDLASEMGVAYFFRAYAHFELLCFFSDFSNDDNPGIPYVSHYHVVGKPARDKVGACFTQIMADLDRAVEMIKTESPDLSADNKARNSNAYVSKAAVNALRARVALYHKEYAPARVYALNALNAIGGIASRDEVEAVWTDRFNAGIIFKLSRPAGSGAIGGIFVGADYSSVFFPTTELTREFLSNDVRKPVFFRMGRDRGGNSVMMVTKWFGDASDIGRVDEKIFRAEEMLLIAVEAMVRGEHPDLAGANTLFNDFCGQRYEDYERKELTAGELMEEVIKERRRELVWEGHRMFDVRRYELSLERDGHVLPFDDYRMVLPIPQAEIDANSSISETDQNRGY